MRWLAPVFFILIFISSLSLVSQRFYLALFLLQVGFYLCAVGAHFIESRNQGGKLLSVPYYFCLINLAALKGIIRLIAGDKGTFWETVRR